MKKLLCLLFGVLMVFSLASCDRDEYVDEVYESVPSVPESTGVSYDHAIKLMMKTFSNDFTKEELKCMYPQRCWTYFAEEKGKSLDDIYTGFSGRMAENWEKTKEAVGENADVKYEILDRTDYLDEDYEALKAKLMEKYGIAADSFGICYEVTLKKATVGKLREDIVKQIYHVLQIDGQWYVSEVLTNMPVI